MKVTLTARELETFRSMLFTLSLQAELELTDIKPAVFNYPGTNYPTCFFLSQNLSEEGYAKDTVVPQYLIAYLFSGRVDKDTNLRLYLTAEEASADLKQAVESYVDSYEKEKRV